MIVISQAEFALIVNPKIRRRVLHLPVKYGQMGERKKCPATADGVYRLTARLPYDAHRARAESEPTRARAVLHLIDLCGRPEKVETITVREKPAIGTVDGVEVYVVKFAKGDQAANLDRPVYLARHNDFTMSASRQTVKGDPELSSPFAKDLQRAREKARDGRLTPRLLDTRLAIGQTSALQQSMVSMKTRNLAKRAERTLRALEVALLAEAVVDSEVVAATNGSRGEADRLPPASTLATPEAA